MNKLNRSIKPEPLGEINFILPEHKVFEIKDGFRLHYYKKENLPIVYTSLAFNTGTSNDPEDCGGTASLLSRLIDEGAGPFNALELNDEIEMLGTNFSINAQQESFSFNFLSMSENFNKTFSLINYIINEPHLALDDFTREKKKLVDSLFQMKDNPSFLASRVFFHEVYKNTKFRRSSHGTAESLNNISLDTVKHFYSENLKKSRADLIVVGDADTEILLRLAENLALSPELPDIPAGSKIQYDDNPPVYIVHKKDSAQAEIRIGHIANHRNTSDFFAKTIMNTILGGQFSSRINLNLRENKGYTYGASSGFRYRKDIGSFIITTAVETKNALAAVSEIFNEIQGIRESISDEEIEFAKSFLVKRFPSMFETYSQIASSINSILFYGLPDDYYKTYIPKVLETDKNQVLKSACDNIFPGKMIITASGDKDKLSEQFEGKFNPIIIDPSDSPIF